VATCTSDCTESLSRCCEEKQSEAADNLLLDTDAFIGLLANTLGRVVRRKKPGLKKNCHAGLNRGLLELSGVQRAASLACPVIE
jgi:hypothetical protein